ncbi:MAG: hypothetical protein ACKO5K_00335 [Armatimonadota bacterium]
MVILCLYAGDTLAMSAGSFHRRRPDPHLGGPIATAVRWLSYEQFLL